MRCFITLTEIIDRLEGTQWSICFDQALSWWYPSPLSVRIQSDEEDPSIRQMWLSSYVVNWNVTTVSNDLVDLKEAQLDPNLRAEHPYRNFCSTAWLALPYLMPLVPRSVDAGVFSLSICMILIFASWSLRVESNSGDNAFSTMVLGALSFLPSWNF